MSTPALTPPQLAWMQMKRDGFEADKQDLVVMNPSTKSTMNLTAQRTIYM
jgi:hypothetical protein